jgi:hypothetical protein
VDNRKDAPDFLVSRRAKVTPAQAGLPTYDDKRRVPGLRREDVASQAGVSSDYYALYTGVLNPDRMPVNLARYVFLDHRSTGFFLDWETIALDTFKR